MRYLIEPRDETDVQIATHKKRYMSPEERQMMKQIIDEYRLVPK